MAIESKDNHNLVALAKITVGGIFALGGVAATDASCAFRSDALNDPQLPQLEEQKAGGETGLSDLRLKYNRSRDPLERVLLAEKINIAGEDYDRVFRQIEQIRKDQETGSILAVLSAGAAVIGGYQTLKGLAAIRQRRVYSQPSLEEREI